MPFVKIRPVVLDFHERQQKKRLKATAMLLSDELRRR